MAKLYLFKTSETAPEYTVRVKDGWGKVGEGTKKVSPKGTVYLEVDYVLPKELSFMPNFDQNRDPRELEISNALLAIEEKKAEETYNSFNK